MTIINECMHCKHRTEEQSIEDHFNIIICDTCRTCSKSEYARREYKIYGTDECRQWFKNNKRHFWSDWF